MRLTVLPRGDVWSVLQVKGLERLGAPYRFEMLLAEGPAPSPLGHAALLEFHGARRHGVVTAWGWREGGRRLAVLSPRLEALDRAAHRRVHVEAAMPGLLARLLRQAGYRDAEFRFPPGLPPPPRTQIRQAAGSDLDHFHRLCAETGLTYRFDQGPDGEEVAFLEAGSPSRPGAPLRRGSRPTPLEPGASREPPWP